MVGEHRFDYASEWAALTSIAGKIGCTTETLRRWCREEASRRSAPAAQTSDDKIRLKLLEREVKELHRLPRSCARRRHILRRLSSTAATNGDGVHRRQRQGLGYRADLP
jgi:hypothetical protein